MSEAGNGSRAGAGNDDAGRVRHDFAPDREAGIESLIEHRRPLAFALGSLNRCMGQEYTCPFGIFPGAIAKPGSGLRVVREAENFTHA